MIYRLDQFEEGRTNPITGENYDESWRIFVLNEAPYTIICGSTKGCAYTLKVSKLHAPWQFSLGDFVSYHTGAGRNIILAVSQKDYEEAMRMYGKSTCHDRFLRPHERPVMVHSTTMESYQSILKDGCLKSWNRIHKEQEQAVMPIGSSLGDPDELLDLIHFGYGTTGEIVVQSKQAGRIIPDEDKLYETGARLYFDMAKIAKDGFLLRDGSGMRVKDRLALDPYLLFAATWKNIGLQSQFSTPRIFAETADRFFREHFSA